MTAPSRRPYREFGGWVRSRRLARRWTQEELARRLSYNVTYVRKIEWGERRPSDALRIRLSQVLAVPVSSLPPSLPARPFDPLPVPPDPLIGRADDLTAVADLLESSTRLVTLLGTAGIGKTRLALALASRFDDRLPAGAVFVPLVDVPGPSGVAGAIAHALGVTPADDGGEVERLVETLHGQERLLVLDNFEHVVEAAPLVEELLARVPGLRVLVTSRHVLDLRRETRYPLPPLRVPHRADEAPDRAARVDAVALFVARAVKVRPDFSLTAENIGAVAEICRRLEGIPLAIELAAGTARFLSPAELLDQLGPGLDLPVDGPRDAPAHQRTLRTAIGWSFDLSSDDERLVLRRLAVFAGGCTLEAATKVCRLPSDPHLDVPRTLVALVAKSMLEPVPGRPGGARFVALETVRAMARERLSAAGELDPMQQRHATWCVALVETTEPQLTGPEQTAALASLDAEHANLSAALRWSLERDPPTASRLCAGLWRFWWIRGHLTEGREWLDAALAHPQPDPVSHARALTGAGVLARTQGAYDRAVDLLKAAAAVARAGGDLAGLALALINQGNVALDRGAYGCAAALFEEAESLSTATGDERGVGHSLNCRGTLCLSEGDLDGAAVLFERAAAIFRDLQDTWSLAMPVANLGWTAHKQGRREVARRMYEKALAMYATIGDDRTVATILLNLGIATAAGDHGEHVDGLFEEALLTFVRLGERRSVAECLEALAAVRNRRDAAHATVLLAAATALRERIAAPPSPDDEDLHGELRERARDALGEPLFDAAWQEGRMLAWEQLAPVAVAMGDAEAPHAG